jgi:hypothetical protein
MKLDRIIWGVLLLFVGGVLLLDNFDVIDFHWWNAWRFFPIFIVILGINILFSRNNSQTGNILSLAILVIALGFLFVKGQEDPGKRFRWRNGAMHFGRKDRHEDNEHIDKNSRVHFAEPFIAAENTKKTVLNISGGAITFGIKGTTDSLFVADVQKTSENFKLSKETRDSISNLTFKMQDQKNDKWSIGDDSSADLYLNTNPIWDINVNLGAGEVDFDLSNYKVRTFNFEGGVAKLETKIGSLLPITDVNVKTGITAVTIEIPESSGCRIKSKTGLSSRDFEGFTKIDKNTYETPNYKASTKKIFINFEGGLTSFSVNKY